MSKAFNPSAWINGVTVAKVSDFQAIATDLYAKGANCDSGGYGMPNTGFVTLIPGALPGTTYTVTGATWAGGFVTYTIGGNVVGVLQIASITGALPAGYNISNGTVTGQTSTTITLALASNPGAWASGGTVTIGTAPGNGTVAVNSSNQVQIYSTATSSWGAATTAVAAGVWHSQAGVPSSGTGNNGDMDLNTSTGDVYGPKAAGVWGSIVENIKGPTGTTGATGATGTTGATGYAPQYIVAAGAPSSGTGNNGDMYINSTTGDVYGPKAGGAWGAIVMNIVGPSGGMADPGANGIMKRTALNTSGVAVANTDYMAALSGTGLVEVSSGAPAIASFTAHGVVIGAGAALPNVTGAGTAGQILTSNGASADPTFQATVTVGAWVTMPTLQNSWVALVAGTYGTPGTAGSTQFVTSRGLIGSGTQTDGTLLFTLVSAQRPAFSVWVFTVALNGSGAILGSAGLLIAPTGAVSVYGISGYSGPLLTLNFTFALF